MKIYKTDKQLASLNNSVVDYILAVVYDESEQYRAQNIFNTLLFVRLYKDLDLLINSKDIYWDLELSCKLKEFELTESNLEILDDLLYKLYMDNKSLKEESFQNIHHYQENEILDFFFNDKVRPGEFPLTLKNNIENSLNHLEDYIYINYSTTWNSNVDFENPWVQIYYIKPEIKEDIKNIIDNVKNTYTPDGVTVKLNV